MFSRTTVGGVYQMPSRNEVAVIPVVFATMAALVGILAGLTFAFVSGAPYYLTGFVGGMMGSILYLALACVKYICRDTRSIYYVDLAQYRLQVAASYMGSFAAALGSGLWLLSEPTGKPLHMYIWSTIIFVFLLAMCLSAAYNRFLRRID